MTTQTLTRHGLRLRPRLRSLRLPNLRAALLMAAVCAAGVQVYGECWAEQAYGHWHNVWAGNTAPAQNLWLPAFTVAIDAKVVEPGLRNLSGITYDYDNDRLLAVTNDMPVELLVLTKNGEVEGRYPLAGFQDPEAITYVGHDRVVIAEERKQRLNMITLPRLPQPLSAAQAQTVTLGLDATRSNKGLEGVTYDRASDRLFAIKERDPLQMWAVTGLMKSVQGPVNVSITDLTPWLTRNRYGSDLSDGYFDPVTRHLLLLSDQSKNITELDSEGRFVSIRSLRATLGGLAKDAPQPEGITMDTDGNLYVVSEPNLFYRFAKPAH
ncbi:MULTISPECIES: SdiA-regulated domain-containing protein [Pseudomonas]|uniref:SdiA-regulated domain-containing protein n=1 Tax=Pseudomonas quercus TaxID=2722792 RepID=A0ABX0YIU2_9PSED|nr:MULTISPECIES: SdiA-regulated domain-containing protein [Pseudomonas]MBF7144837.1 SdiA-regulated domain-containing protein [Pseudomonas sp. LY10J]NJP03373.1 SdiA-regulated domain-containing protein [Pseudomonas quercus]